MYMQLGHMKAESGSKSSARSLYRQAVAADPAKVDAYKYIASDIESILYAAPSDLGMHWPPKDSLEAMLEAVVDDAGVSTASSSHQNPAIETAHALLRRKVRQGAPHDGHFRRRRRGSPHA